MPEDKTVDIRQHDSRCQWAELKWTSFECHALSFAWQVVAQEKFHPHVADQTNKNQII